MSIPLSDSASSLGSIKFPPSPPLNKHELSSLTKVYDPCQYLKTGQADITTFYSPANSLYEPDGTSTIASTPPMSGIHQVNDSSSILQHPSVSHVLHPPQSTIAHAPPCPQCKGNKYGFTPYFHNKQIFPEPPHVLLMLVEQTYLLRNRLKSLLINYVTRRVDNNRLEAIANEIVEWKSRVECLSREVLISSVGFELNTEALEAVNKWATEMVERLSNHVHGIEKMKLSSEEQKGLLIEFKKLWEVVWTSYLVDRNNRKTSGRSLRSSDD